MKFPNYTLGLVTGFCLGCLYFMLPTIIKSFQEDPVEPPPKSNFEVVDTYKGCDVVRWTQSNFAEYKYFMKCPK